MFAQKVANRINEITVTRRRLPPKPEKTQYELNELANYHKSPVFIEELGRVENELIDKILLTANKIVADYEKSDSLKYPSEFFVDITEFYQYKEHIGILSIASKLGFSSVGSALQNRTGYCQWFLELGIPL